MDEKTHPECPRGEQCARRSRISIRETDLGLQRARRSRICNAHQAFEGWTCPIGGTPRDGSGRPARMGRPETLSRPVGRGALRETRSCRRRDGAPSTDPESGFPALMPGPFPADIL